MAPLLSGPLKDRHCRLTWSNRPDPINPKASRSRFLPTAVTSTIFWNWRQRFVLASPFPSRRAKNSQFKRLCYAPRRWCDATTPSLSPSHAYRKGERDFCPPWEGGAAFSAAGGFTGPALAARGLVVRILVGMAGLLLVILSSDWPFLAA